MVNDIINWLRTAKPEWTETDKHMQTALTKMPINEERLVQDLISEELAELCAAMAFGDRDGILDACVDLIWVTCNPLAMYGFSMEEVAEKIKKVSESNWSKFCDTRLEADETVRMYAEGSHPDKPEQRIGTYWKKVGDMYVIFRCADDKIMKSYKYVKA